MTYRYVNAALDFRVVNLAGDWRLPNDDDRLPPEYPMPPAVPTVATPISATITSVSPTFVSVSNSLRRQVQSRGAHLWAIELQYGAMTRATFAPLWSFLVSRAGQFTPFTISVPGLTTPQGTALGTPLVNGAVQSGKSLITDGWTINQAAVLKAGDWIQVDGDAKVYQVTANCASNGSGQATIPIYPALRKTPTDNVPVHIDPVFTVALAADSLPTDFDQCLKARGFELSMLEVLS